MKTKHEINTDAAAASAAAFVCTTGFTVVTTVAAAEAAAAASVLISCFIFIFEFSILTFDLDFDFVTFICTPAYVFFWTFKACVNSNETKARTHRLAWNPVGGSNFPHVGGFPFCVFAFGFV